MVRIGLLSTLHHGFPFFMAEDIRVSSRVEFYSVFEDKCPYELASCSFHYKSKRGNQKASRKKRFRIIHNLAHVYVPIHVLVRHTFFRCGPSSGSLCEH